MNEQIMKSAGFGKEVDAVKKGLRPFCGKKKIDMDDFEDDLSRKEYEISGLCQKC